MSTATKAQVIAALNLTRALEEAIREARRIPSGHLYAVVMGAMSMQSYEKAIDMLVRVGAVRREGNDLISLLESLEAAAAM